MPRDYWGIFHRSIGASFVIAPPLYYTIRPLFDSTGYNMPKLTQSDFFTVAGFTLMGVACYYVGDRMRARKLEERKIDLLEHRIKREGKESLSQRVDS